MKKINLSKPKITKKMIKYFLKRTKLHIKLVGKYCNKLYENGKNIPVEIISRGMKHDKSKFLESEYIPYIYLTWKYKCKDDGVDFDITNNKGMIDKATKYHVFNNRHHPEFHSQGIDEKNKDVLSKKIIDATLMEDIDIMEMVCDWCAMSEERDNSPYDWAEKTINKKWKFTKEQEKLIYRCIDLLV